MYIYIYYIYIYIYILYISYIYYIYIYYIYILHYYQWSLIGFRTFLKTSACHRTIQTLIIAISINPSTGKQALYFACVTVSSGTCLLLYVKGISFERIKSCQTG